MTDYRKIMLLLLAGQSYRDIQVLVGCSHRTVSLAKKRLAETGLSVEGLARLSDGEVAGLFPDGRSRVSEGYEQPDFAKMARSMKANQHFTVLQGWRSYMASASSLRKYGYSQFCALFADYAQRNDLTAVIAHKPRSFMRAV